MAQYIKQGNIFGRIGSGIGQGLAEQIPKEVERSRLSSGLKALGEKKGLTPFQQYAGLVGAAHEYPQVVQSGSDLLRQQAIIDSIKQSNAGKNVQPENKRPQTFQGEASRSITTPQGINAKLNPYIPPTGEELEQRARQRFANEPLIYPTIESARNAENAQVQADMNKSQSAINAENLKQEVQTKGEQELKREIETLGAQVPGTVLSRLESDALEEIKSGKISEKDASKKYGKIADLFSKDYSDIHSWGDMTLVNNGPKAILTAMENVRKSFKDLGYKREFADALIAENGHSPTFAYAVADPVKDHPSLNGYIKSLPSILPKIEKVAGLPGLAGLGTSRPKGKNASQETLKIAPDLARKMGKEGSPLAVAYEIEKKGYDPQVWKDYLTRNSEKLDLTRGQIQELQKSDKSWTSWLNDWWLRSFSGIE